MTGDATQKEFAQEILALKDTLGFTNRPAEFAGMLMGAAVVMAQDAGLSKGQIIAVASRTYDNAARKGVANDA